MIALQNITLTFGDRILFDDISFLIDVRDRIGLVGNNGEGKSTLLKLILHEQKPTEGSIEVPANIRIGYLPQHMVIHDNTTVYKEVYKAFYEIRELNERFHQINEELETRKDYESDSYGKLLDELNHVSDQLALQEAEKVDEKIEKTLYGLGFVKKDLDQPTQNFSGGWRMRIELAKILLQNPDALLLDEPTNHLDIESIQWLEDYLQDFSGAIVLISHDRRFLDNIIKRTIEISLGNIYDYKVSYSKFVHLQAERIEQQKAAYKNQQKTIAENQRFIERFRYKATKASQVQSRIKQMEKMDKIQIDEKDYSRINIRFQPPPRSGTIAIETKGLSKSYGYKQVLQNVDFIAERGERIAFVGKNGEGKSTFIKMINNEIDFTGKIKHGHNLRIGYFAQNQDELLDESKTVFETIHEVTTDEMQNNVRDILGAFLFSGEEIDKKVKVLSGGERSRLAIIKLLLKPYNLLILDEPTNHLDMRSKDILKNALSEYQGTVIVVSHDREFLDGFAQKIYEFKNKKIKEFIGSINDFLNKKKRLYAIGVGMKSRQTPKKEDIKSEKTNDINKNKQEHEQQKKYDRQKRQLENKIKNTEKNIEKLEEALEILNQQMQQPEKHNDLNAGNIYEKLQANGSHFYISEDKSIYEKYEELKKQLENEMKTWEMLNLELEEL